MQQVANVDFVEIIFTIVIAMLTYLLDGMVQANAKESV